MSGAEPSCAASPGSPGATICVVWGTTYVAIKIALETIPPFLMGGLRYIAAGSDPRRSRGGAVVTVFRRQGSGAALAVLGFLMLLMGNGGVVWGAQYLPSGLVGSPRRHVTVLDDRCRRVDARREATLRAAVDWTAGRVRGHHDPGVAGHHRRRRPGRNFAFGVIACSSRARGGRWDRAYTRRHVTAGRRARLAACR